MDSKLRSSIISDLRKRSSWLPIRREAIDRSKVDVLMPNGKNKTHYKCNHCAYLSPRQKDIDVDHIEPVVPVTGFVSWDNLIYNFFEATVDDLQVLCKPCHKKKSAGETKIRAKHRRLKKMKSELLDGHTGN